MKVPVEVMRCLLFSSCRYWTALVADVGRLPLIHYTITRVTAWLAHCLILSLSSIQFCSVCLWVFLTTLPAAALLPQKHSSVFWHTTHFIDNELLREDGQRNAAAVASPFSVLHRLLWKHTSLQCIPLRDFVAWKQHQQLWQQPFLYIKVFLSNSSSRLSLVRPPTPKAFPCRFY